MEGSIAQRAARLTSALKGAAPKDWRGLARNRLVLFALGPILLALAVLTYFLLNGGTVSTDDATVSSARVAISPEVRGRIVSVRVHDNQTVHAGDVLIQLDDTDYQTALADAQARLASARLQVAALRATYSEAAAQTGSAQATENFARQELARQRNLFRAGVASQHDVDDAQRAAQVAARQAAAAAQAQTSTLANLGGALHLPVDEHPLVLQAKAALVQAQTDLADTTIRAPQDGVVAHVDQVQIGSYAQPAQALFWLVSGAPWIDAAFKENQLEHLRPGEPATIHIDAFPHTTFHGHVVSLSPGTGSTFSVLPAQNASGNWVKVVQRVSVRVAIDDAPRDLPLAVGLSSGVRIDTRHSAASGDIRGREQ